MTDADKIASTGKVPRRWTEAAYEVSAVCQDAYKSAEGNADLTEISKNHGLHAYRYEECDDGSVITFYAIDPDGEVLLKAFDSIQEASLWSPRDEKI